MTLENLENQYQQALDETLNQLQTVNLLVAQLEAKMEEVRQSMLNLSQTVEEILASKKTSDS